MKVCLKFGWFSPTQVEKLTVEGNRIIRSRSGRFYRPGVYDIDDDLVSYLPKSAVIVDKEEDVAPKKELDLKDLDEVRAEQEALARATQEAELERDKQAKGRNMAHARAARKKDK